VFVAVAGLYLAAFWAIQRINQSAASSHDG
jgi:hypothetical protein